MPLARAVRHALLVALARATTTLLCWWSGFRAISDDDYSRVVIAARFAHHPSPDPSGTSWLPLPFWSYGVPMAMFGDSLGVARGVALVLGVASALLVWQAARLLGLGERAALGGALGAVVLPYGCWLSAATVPEAPTAALLLFGAVTLARSEGRLRAWGGLALGAACFCRYESWTAALVFAVVTVVDARRARDGRLWLAAALALAPIALWLLHGVVRHGDAWFFVARVAQYRAALGGESPELVTALLSAPAALVRFEPELFAVFFVCLVLVWRDAGSPFDARAWRSVAVLGSLVVFLSVAAARGSSATHHPERSLLPVFWFLALLTAGLVARLAERPRPWLLPALAPPCALLASLLLRPELLRTFADRREEEQVGSMLARIGARDVAIDTADYGYFAVQAALGYGKSWVLTEHDPRKPREARPATTEALARRLRGVSSRYLVTTRDRMALALPLGSVRLTTERLALIALEPADSP
ncbi:MAG: hypothetical protein EOO73_25085 [Myxococcales bacterium]|nr:MAG: hypothetical protein EOO73_25085 [Myxococcales bacterium]